ncbi:protein root UVB sensitive 6 [Typha latifolia]|uniref:protein root UVB sensitive 6 n=1 Tax=Typha latifolia TaxID=4733 RepID=UPI003C2F1D24
MAPIPLKQSTSSAQTLARTGASPETRAIVREAVRATAAATLASPPPAAPAPPLATDQIQAGEVRFGPPVAGVALDSTTAAAVESRVLCWEEIDGRRWSYVVDTESRHGKRARKGSAVRAVPMQSPAAPVEELMSFIRSYVVPEGFPDSVTPSYVPYMTWRALKHFFGGAMGVFTTQTLLSSVGVSRNQAAPGAVAINWILKDGAGRVGKMLFARQGKKFDYDLKQLRFSGDLLMELGAGVELATAAFPHLFLPMACAANVAKNVAAVTSTSTRTPIYKAYAKGENIGDVTAKGECVGNIADLMGTGLSILISKRNPSLVASFAFLSCGYVLSSYQEVKSVVLNTLNRARFTVAVDSFIKTGFVPSLKEGNSKEKIFSPPWVKHTPVVLGPRFGDAFQEPASFVATEPLFEKERYIVTYNPSKDKIYALLKDQAKPDDILKAAFHAYVLLHFIDSSNGNRYPRTHMNSDPQKLNETVIPSNMDFLAQIAESCKIVSSSYGVFKKKAAEQGWIMSESLLNPGRARLCGLKEE